MMQFNAERIADVIPSSLTYLLYQTLNRHAGPDSHATSSVPELPPSLPQLASTPLAASSSTAIPSATPTLARAIFDISTPTCLIGKRLKITNMQSNRWTAERRRGVYRRPSYHVVQELLYERDEVSVIRTEFSQTVEGPIDGDYEDRVLKMFRLRAGQAYVSRLLATCVMRSHAHRCTTS